MWLCSAQDDYYRQYRTKGNPYLSCPPPQKRELFQVGSSTCSQLPDTLGPRSQPARCTQHEAGCNAALLECLPRAVSLLRLQVWIYWWKHKVHFLFDFRPSRKLASILMLTGGAAKQALHLLWKVCGIRAYMKHFTIYSNLPFFFSWLYLSHFLSLSVSFSCQDPHRLVWRISNKKLFLKWEYNLVLGLLNCCGFQQLQFSAILCSKM